MLLHSFTLRAACRARRSAVLSVVQKGNAQASCAQLRRTMAARRKHGSPSVSDHDQVCRACKRGLGRADTSPLSRKASACAGIHVDLLPTGCYTVATMSAEREGLAEVVTPRCCRQQAATHRGHAASVFELARLVNAPVDASHSPMCRIS